MQQLLHWMPPIQTRPNPTKNPPFSYYWCRTNQIMANGHESDQSCKETNPKPIQPNHLQTKSLNLNPPSPLVAPIEKWTRLFAKMSPLSNAALSTKRWHQEYFLVTILWTQNSIDVKKHKAPVSFQVCISVMKSTCQEEETTRWVKKRWEYIHDGQW